MKVRRLVGYQILKGKKMKFYSVPCKPSQCSWKRPCDLFFESSRVCSFGEFLNSTTKGRGKIDLKQKHSRKADYRQNAGGRKKKKKKREKTYTIKKYKFSSPLNFKEILGVCSCMCAHSRKRME